MRWTRRRGSCVLKKAALQALRVINRRKTGVVKQEDQYQTRPALLAFIAVDRRGERVGEQDGACIIRERNRESKIDGI